MRIRASLFSIPPYTLPGKNGVGSFVGPIPTLIENLSQRLNFSYEILIPPDGSVSLKLANGSWTSFRGMIERNETEIVFGPEVIMAEQMEGVKYGSYYTIANFFFFASAGDSEIVDFSKLVLAFDLEIWYFLLALIIILSNTVSLFDFANEIFKGKRLRNKLLVFEANLWMFMASFFQEGTPRMPHLQKSRFVYGIWLMAVLIMMNAYSCQLKTALMVKGHGDTMYTIKDLANRPDLTVFIRQSGYLEKVFEESPIEEYRRVWDNIVARGKDGLVSIERLFSKYPYERVKAGKGVVLNPQEVVKNLLEGYCPTIIGDRRFYFINQPVFSNIFLYYFSPLVPDRVIRQINIRIRWIVEAQLMQYWIEQRHKNYDRLCLSGSQNENTETQGLGYEHIQPIIYMTLMLQSFTVLVLMLEICANHFTKLRYKLRQNRKNRFLLKE